MLDGSINKITWNMSIPPSVIRFLISNYNYQLSCIHTKILYPLQNWYKAFISARAFIQVIEAQLRWWWYLLSRACVLNSSISFTSLHSPKNSMDEMDGNQLICSTSYYYAMVTGGKSQPNTWRIEGYPLDLFWGNVRIMCFIITQLAKINIHGQKILKN